MDTGSTAVFTDAPSRFSVRVASDRVSGVRISKPGFLTEQYQFAVDGPPNLIRLRVPEGGIYGKVTDETGRPIERFRVTVRIPPDIPRSAIHERDFKNNQGLFSITDIAAGVYDLTIASLPDSPNKTWDMKCLDGVEIRAGCYYGEIQVQPSCSRKDK